MAQALLNLRSLRDFLREEGQIDIRYLRFNLRPEKRERHKTNDHANAARISRTFHNVLTIALALHIDDRLIDTLLTATSIDLSSQQFSPHYPPQH
jgi:hypothetical protein